MANEKPLEQRILNYIQRCENVSFAELTRHVEGFRGDCCFFATAKENIVLWDGMSKEAGQVLNHLLKLKKISLKPCNPLIYLIDGLSLRYPIVKQVRDYKKPHWLPVVIDPVK